MGVSKGRAEKSRIDLEASEEGYIKKKLELVRIRFLILDLTRRMIALITQDELMAEGVRGERGDSTITNIAFKPVTFMYR